MAVMPRPFAPQNARVHDTPVAPLRRCTFRRITNVAGARELPLYEVACMFPDRKVAIPLGDIEASRPICDACTYQGIFRADSD